MRRHGFGEIEGKVTVAVPRSAIYLKYGREMLDFVCYDAARRWNLWGVLDCCQCFYLFKWSGACEIKI